MVHTERPAFSAGLNELYEQLLGAQYCSAALGCSLCGPCRCVWSLELSHGAFWAQWTGADLFLPLSYTFLNVKEWWKENISCTTRKKKHKTTDECNRFDDCFTSYTLNSTAVGTAQSVWREAGRPRNRGSILERDKRLFSFPVSRPPLGPIQLTIQWLPEAPILRQSCRDVIPFSCIY